jgi:hypothetical protein
MGIGVWLWVYKPSSFNMLLSKKQNVNREAMNGNLTCSGSEEEYNCTRARPSILPSCNSEPQMILKKKKKKKKKKNMNKNSYSRSFVWFTTKAARSSML